MGAKNFGFIWASVALLLLNSIAITVACVRNRKRRNDAYYNEDYHTEKSTASSGTSGVRFPLIRKHAKTTTVAADNVNAVPQDQPMLAEQQGVPIRTVEEHTVIAQQEV